MDKIITFLGLVLLGAASYGVYNVLQNHTNAEEEPGQAIETTVAVHVGKVRRMTLRDYVHAYGSIELDPGTSTSPPATVRITSSWDGLITEARCVEGQRVEKGDVLFQLDSRVADAAVEKARQSVAFATKNFERQQQLRSVEGTSDKLYLEVQQTLELARAELASAQAQRTLLTVQAPFTGTIARLTAKAGETVALAQELAELRDLERAVAVLGVPSREIGQVVLGQQVEFDSETPIGTMSPGASAATGQVIYIDPQVDPSSDTVAVRSTVPDGAAFRPGQFVQARIITEVRPDCLAVPVESVYTGYDGRSTLSIVEGEVARQKVVQVGLRDGGYFQVEGEGVSEGATVVTLGSYALPEETKVQVLAAAN